MAPESKRRASFFGDVKLTDKVRETILEHLLIGHHRSTAASAAGISPQLLAAWLKQGEELIDTPQEHLIENEVLVNLYYSVAEAEAIAEDALVTLWHKTGRKEWTAAKDFLERRYPNKWGPAALTVKNQISGDVAVKHSINLTKLSNEDLATLETIVTKSS